MSNLKAIDLLAQVFSGRKNGCVRVLFEGVNWCAIEFERWLLRLSSGHGATKKGHDPAVIRRPFHCRIYIHIVTSLSFKAPTSHPLQCIFSDQGWISL